MRGKVKLIMAGLAAYGLYALAGGRPRGCRPGRRNGQGALNGPDQSRKRWDEVDQASYESFPASDPPFFSGGKL